MGVKGLLRLLAGDFRPHPCRWEFSIPHPRKQVFLFDPRKWNFLFHTPTNRELRFGPCCGNLRSTPWRARCGLSIHCARMHTTPMSQLLLNRSAALVRRPVLLCRCNLLPASFALFICIELRPNRDGSNQYNAVNFR